MTASARDRVRHGGKAGGRDFLAAVFADAVQAERQSFQGLIDGLDLLAGGFSDSLQGFVVLDLDGTVARIGHQWLISVRKVTVDPALAHAKLCTLRLKPASYLFDCVGLYGHRLDSRVVEMAVRGKIRPFAGRVFKGQAQAMRGCLGYSALPE